MVPAGCNVIAMTIEIRNWFVAVIAHCAGIMHSRLRRFSVVAGMAALATVNLPMAQNARSQEWRTFSMPVRHGAVIRYRYPSAWSVHLASRNPHGAFVALTTPTKQRVTFSVNFGDSGGYWTKRYKSQGAALIERFVADEMKRVETLKSKRTGQLQVLRNGRSSILSQPAHFHEYAVPSKGHQSGPVHARWSTIYRDRFLAWPPSFRWR